MQDDRNFRLFERGPELAVGLHGFQDRFVDDDDIVPGQVDIREQFDQLLCIAAGYPFDRHSGGVRRNSGAIFRAQQQDALFALLRYLLIGQMDRATIDKAAADTKIALHLQRAAHLGGHLLADGQAETGATKAACDRGIGLRKWFENPLPCIVGNADAAIADREP